MKKKLRFWNEKKWAFSKKREKLNLLGWSHGWSIGWSIGLSLGYSLDWSLGWWLTKWLIKWITWLFAWWVGSRAVYFMCIPMLLLFTSKVPHFRNFRTILSNIFIVDQPTSPMPFRATDQCLPPPGWFGSKSFRMFTNRLFGTQQENNNK